MNPEDKNSIQKKPPKNYKNILGIIIIILLGILAGSLIINQYILVTTLKEEVKNSKAEMHPSKEANEPEIEVEIYKQNEKINSELIDTLLRGEEYTSLRGEFVKEKKVEANDISNQRAYFIVEQNEYETNEKDAISLEEYANKVKEYLGEEYSFNPQTISFDKICSKYRYNPSTNTFLKQETSCKKEGEYTAIYKPIKEIKRKNSLEIDIRVLFYNAKTKEIFADYQETKSLGIFDEKNIPYNNGTMYRFSFKEQDGKYIFISSEPLS